MFSTKFFGSKPVAIEQGLMPVKQVLMAYEDMYKAGVNAGLISPEEVNERKLAVALLRTMEDRLTDAVLQLPPEPLDILYQTAITTRGVEPTPGNVFSEGFYNAQAEGALGEKKPIIPEILALQSKYRTSLPTEKDTKDNALMAVKQVLMAYEDMYKAAVNAGRLTTKTSAEEVKKLELATAVLHTMEVRLTAAVVQLPPEPLEMLYQTAITTRGVEPTPGSVFSEGFYVAQGEGALGEKQPVIPEILALQSKYRASLPIEEDTKSNALMAVKKVLMAYEDMYKAAVNAGRLTTKTSAEEVKELELATVVLRTMEDRLTAAVVQLPPEPLEILYQTFITTRGVEPTPGGVFSEGFYSAQGEGALGEKQPAVPEILALQNWLERQEPVASCTCS